MTQEYGLGRNETPFDSRDWTPATLKAMVKLGVVHPMKWTAPAFLNQGKTPHCVGFSGATFISAAGSQAGVTGGVTDQLGHDLYYECKVLDGEPGRENGSNLRSLGKVLKTRGIIDAYSITDDVDAIQEWVEHYGMVVLGIPWYEGMYTKDSNGVIRPTGDKLGGHAICDYAVGQVRDNGLWNTWGTWGSCWLSNSDMRRLMSERGDALLTVKKGPPPKNLPWELEALSASGQLVLTQDDRESIAVAYAASAFHGFEDGTFRPHDPVTEHQVVTVLGNLGRKAPKETSGSWERAATRGWVRDNFPGLVWLEERWTEVLTRLQLLLLVGRMLRGV